MLPPRPAPQVWRKANRHHTVQADSRPAWSNRRRQPTSQPVAV